MYLVEVNLPFDHGGRSARIDLVDDEDRSAEFDVVEGGFAPGGDSLLKSVYWFSTFVTEDHNRLDTMVGGSKRRRRKKFRR